MDIDDRREITRHFAPSDNQPKEGYACIGSVRGWCGTVHQSLDTASKCCGKDSRACSNSPGGGYSDRRIFIIKGGEVEL